MKKTIIISSIVLVSAIILTGVCIVLFSTVTYSGVIVDAKAKEDYIEFTVKDEKTSEQFTVLADERTDVRYCHLEKDVYLGDLMNETGSTVEISCKRYFNHNKYSESIVVEFVHDNSD